MKTSLLLSAALGLVLVPLSVTDVHAQQSISGGEHQLNPHPNKRAKQESKQAPKAAALFPKATRAEPAQTGAPSLSKQLQALFDAQEKASADEQIAKADAIIGDPRATPFDKANAGYIAAAAWQSKDTKDYTNATKYLEGAVAANGLNNNTHYQLMLQLAQMLASDDKHAQALTYVDHFLTETGSEDAKAYAVKANVLYEMKRYPESVEAVKKALAIKPDDNLIRMLVADYVEMDKPAEAAKVLEDMLARKPNDKNLLLNLASAYQQAGNDAKAGQVFDRLRSAGLLTETKDYETAYRLLANIDGREKDALAIVEEGLKKGVLKPDADIYGFQGQMYYNADQMGKAIEAWSKAAPLAKTGDIYLNLAKLQVGEQHWALAKAAARSGLDKGVKKPGEAWLVIARSEQGLGNKAGMQSAFREAAKYPESRKTAEAALRQTSKK
ncbi:MAG: tetratricopeptide repeat protein [Arenimonas sp.]